MAKLKDQGQGPWDVDWANPTAYPHIDKWPGNERWFSNRCSPMGSEFTIHQNIGPAAAIYGFLCAEAKAVKREDARRVSPAAAAHGVHHCQVGGPLTINPCDGGAFDIGGPR